ncbi:hypothetical protein GCM10027162_08610 [Streptomyces incanus]
MGRAVFAVPDALPADFLAAAFLAVRLSGSPGSEYYDGSAPLAPIGRHRACPR